MKLVYLDLVPLQERDVFAAAVCSVSAFLEIDSNWLMAVMKAESGIKANARNTSFPFMKDGKLDGYATGLVQFIPSTARSMGTTTWDLEKLSRVEQMDYVKKYFAPYKGKIKSYFDLYMVTFFPAGLPNSENADWVFETSKIRRASIAKSNPTIDINKDGKITIAEFRQYLINTVKPDLRGFVFGALKKPVTVVSGISISLVLLLLVIWSIFK
jgi:Transglycosylase SLT domain